MSSSRGNELGGVSTEVLNDILASVKDTKLLGEYLHIGRPRGKKQYVIGLTRLGVSRTPDSLGTVTATRRPLTIQAALQGIDRTARRVRGK